MADTGLIALDPVRLARLEAYLVGLDQGCRRRAAAVADAATAAGVAPPAPTGELELIAAWCRRTADEVRWRRAVLDGLPPLPWPPLHFTSRAEARRRADELADRFIEAMAEVPPRAAVLRRLMEELARGAHSLAFVGAVAESLGPARLDRLPVLLERLGVEPPPGADLAGAPPAEQGAAPQEDDLLARVSAVVREVLASSSAVGDDDAVDAVLGDVGPEIAERIEDLGFANDTLGNVVRAVRALRRTPGARIGPMAGGGLVLDVLDLVRDPSDVTGLRSGASLLTIVAPFTGPAAPFAYGGAAVFAMWAELIAGAQMSPSQRDDFQRRYDPDRGHASYPSGSATNPWVDDAGVPLPPGYA